MGRLTERHKKLTLDIKEFLLGPEEVQKDLKVGLTVLESYRKSRNPERKKRFKKELTNVIARLSINSYIHQKETAEANETIEELKKELIEKDKHCQSWKNQAIKLETSLADSKEYRQMYEDQKKSSRSAERDYGILYRQNDHLETRVDDLKKKIKELKAQVKTSKK